MKMMMYCRGGSKDDSDSDDGHHYDEEGDNDEFYDDDADDDCDEGFPVLAAVWCHREHLVPLSPLGCTLSTLCSVQCTFCAVRSVHSGKLFPIRFTLMVCTLCNALQ